MSPHATLLAALCGCFGTEMASPAFSLESEQHDPRRLTIVTESTQGTTYWVKLAYQLVGGPDSAITSVRQGTSRVEHRLPPVTRDSFNLPKPAAGVTVTGQGCVQSKRRGLLSNEVCAGWSFTTPTVDQPPPDPVLDSVRTDTASTPSAGGTVVIFSDSFANGARAPGRNGFRWTGTNGPVPPRVVAVSGSYSGYALRFTFVGNTSLTADAFSEQRFALDPPGRSALFLCAHYRIPVNYRHRPVSPANNKGLRLWGGVTGNESQDESYQNSAVKAGWSTLARSDTTSQLIVEFGLAEVGTGNFGTGPWTSWFTRGTLERIGFYAQAGTQAETGTPSSSTMTGPPNDGRITVWRNGVKVYDRNDLRMFTPGALNTFLWGYLLGWSNSGFDVTTEIDLYWLEVSTAPQAHCTS